MPLSAVSARESEPSTRITRMLATAPVISHCTYASHAPSGDHAGAPQTAAPGVRSRGSAPFAAATKTWLVPPRSETKATRVRSGDQGGAAGPTTFPLLPQPASKQPARIEKKGIAPRPHLPAPVNRVIAPLTERDTGSMRDAESC